MNTFRIFKIVTLSLAALWIGVLINSCKQSSSSWVSGSAIEHENFQLKYLNGGIIISKEDGTPIPAEEISVRKFMAAYVVQANGSTKFGISELEFTIKKVDYKYVPGTYSSLHFKFIAEYTKVVEPTKEEKKDVEGEFDKLGLKVELDNEANFAGFMKPAARVSDVQVGSSAAAKGVTKDYCVESVNGRSVLNLDEYKSVLATLKSGVVIVDLLGCTEAVADKTIQFQVTLTSTDSANSGGSSKPTPTPTPTPKPVNNEEPIEEVVFDSSSVKAAVHNYTSGFFSKFCSAIGGQFQVTGYGCSWGENRALPSPHIPYYVAQIDQKMEKSDSEWLSKVCNSFNGAVEGSSCKFSGSFLKDPGSLSVPYLSGMTPSEFSISILRQLDVAWKD